MSNNYYVEISAERAYYVNKNFKIAFVKWKIHVCTRCWLVVYVRLTSMFNDISSRIIPTSYGNSSLSCNISGFSGKNVVFEEDMNTIWGHYLLANTKNICINSIELHFFQQIISQKCLVFIKPINFRSGEYPTYWSNYNWMRTRIGLPKNKPNTLYLHRDLEDSSILSQSALSRIEGWTMSLKLHQYL